MTNAQIFETLFLIFLFGDFALKFYLDYRQIKYVRKHRHSVPHAFAERVSLEAHQKAADYTVDNIRLQEIARAVTLVFVLILTLGGLLQWIYEISVGWLSDGILAQVLMVLICGFLSSAIELPFSWYSTFKVEAKYGFNNTTKQRFVKDLLLSTAVSLFLGIPILAVVFWLWDAGGQLWWLWAWSAYVVFNLVVLWIYPAFIAPLFNKFTPLPEGDMRGRLEALLKRTGFQSNGLYVMDASKRNSKGNAYMTGFGKNKRIVLFDTLLKKLTPSETEAVLAHELGHYKLRHIYKMMIVSFLSSLVFFWVLSLISDSSWFYEGLGVHLSMGPSHGAALILFTVVVSVFLFPLSPLQSIFSRKMEFEADAFSVRNSDWHSMISALVKLFSDNASTLTPDPVYSAFYSSHPDAMTRVQAIQRLAPRHTRQRDSWLPNS